MTLLVLAVIRREPFQEAETVLGFALHGGLPFYHGLRCVTFVTQSGRSALQKSSRHSETLRRIAALKRVALVRC